MTKKPNELLHMDAVGSTQVCSFGGKWYVLVIVDDFSHYSCVFLWRQKMRFLLMLETWFFSCKNEFPKNAMRAIHSDNGTKFKNFHFETFLLFWYSSISFPLHMYLSRMALLNARIWPLLMLDEHRTPSRFWVETINTGCHVSNHIFLWAFLNKNVLWIAIVSSHIFLWAFLNKNLLWIAIWTSTQA
jgi:hypothetical protein